MTETSSERKDVAERVYEMVSRIPYGRVTTYGDLARGLGNIRAARMVGWLMHSVPEDRELPCHRVVNRIGYLSGGWHFGHPDIMRARLLAENVPFIDEYQVELAKCRWTPWEDDSTSSDEVDDFDPIASGDGR